MTITLQKNIEFVSTQIWVYSIINVCNVFLIYFKYLTSVRLYKYLKNIIVTFNFATFKIDKLFYFVCINDVSLGIYIKFKWNSRQV